MMITPPASNKGNILLVDDLPENLQLLSDLLIQLGYGIRSVTSGKMALKTLKVKQPELILLDIKMPEMDGYQVCEAIKADIVLCEIPIIFISALDDTFDKVKAFECGGVDYISKPFHIEEVVARIENQLIIQRQKTALLEEVRKRQEAEEVLYQSRALLASVLNSALDGIAALQAVRSSTTGEIEDFRCLVVNPIIARAFNRNREELIGKLVFKKFIQRINPTLFERMVTIVETGEPIEEDFYYPIDESCWYHFVAVKLGDGFAITVRDITTRKNIELALQKANQELHLLAHLDGLTKIANRRCFDEFLAKQWQELAQLQQPLSLLMIDVDYFKLYNDTYGHQSGDDCLIQIAQTICKVISQCDFCIQSPCKKILSSSMLVARYGGEEFAVILPQINQTQAITIAQAICTMVTALALPHQASGVSKFVSVSVGLACLIPDTTNSCDALLAQADSALYKAKLQGRNGCHCFGSS